MSETQMQSSCPDPSCQWCWTNLVELVVQYKLMMLD